VGVLRHGGGFENFRLNGEALALLEEAEKQAKADTTKTKKAQPTKSTNGVIEWDNLDLRTVRITPASSRLGDYILSPDNKKLFYFSATEAGQDLWVYDMRKGTTQLQKKMNLSSPFFASDKKGTKFFILGASPMTLDPKTDATKAITMAGHRRIDRIREREVMYEEVVREEEDGTVLLYIDRHLVHEVTSPQAFEGLKMAGRKLWRIDSVVSTADHNTPTGDWDKGIQDPISKLQVDTLDKNIKEFGALAYFPLKQ